MSILYTFFYAFHFALSRSFLRCQSLTSWKSGKEQAILLVVFLVANRNPSISICCRRRCLCTHTHTHTAILVAITCSSCIRFGTARDERSYHRMLHNDSIFIEMGDSFMCVRGSDAHLNKWNCHKKCLRIFALMRVSSSLLCHKHLFA